MIRSTDKDASECHVLDFFYDDDNGCALTVFTNGVRFHIIADAERLKAKSAAGKSIEHEYRKLISAVRDEVEGDKGPDKVQKQKDLEAAEMHNPNEEHNESQDSGHGTVSEHRDTEDERHDKDDDKDNDTDSAVDVSEENPGIKEIGIRDSGVVLGERHAPEAEKLLQNWMLSPLSELLEDLAPASKTQKDQTLKEWYYGPAHFFNLEIKDSQLSLSEEEAAVDLTKCMSDLVPRMPLPKYIKDLNIPLIRADEITVLEEGTEPEPYHPVRVKVNGETQFLKLVDMLQYQPTKREIKLLKEVEQKGLHNKFHVPQVLGLVYEEKKSEIMGFLQTDIEGPTPLTKMLDSDVVEANRKKWAKETERIMKLLHESNIIWGDAKADNFMVDKHGELWIIDFGGSYTNGWVDPELMETQEGDDMGTQKIVNALQDPESNTFEPANESEGNKSSEPKQTSRKRSRTVDDNDGEDQPSKRQR